MSDADLIIVGAGAKAAAIAAKVHALNSLEPGTIRLTIIEANKRAASWAGENGMTSGEEPLAVPPIKDVGYPYESHELFGELGDALDHAVMSLSWQQYLIGKREYARWVNAGSPAVRHRDFGEYLNWVFSRASAGVNHVSGRVTQVSLREPDEQWVVDVAEPSGTKQYAGNALVLTGPGVHRHLPHDQEAASRMFHNDSRRSDIAAAIPTGASCEVAIVGGGESALSCAVFLREFRPDAILTIYTPTLPLSRGESFVEDRVFSNPDEVGWSSLDQQMRRDFIRHCDCGVFDAGSLATIARDDHVRFIIGRAVHVAAQDSGDGIRLDYVSSEGVNSDPHDFIVNCTGFDLLEQLRGLFPEELRAVIERRVGQLWDRPPEAEVSFGRFLELEGMRPRLQIPGLAGLSQGPGFANLGCLGLLSNRVLAPLLLRPGAHADPDGSARDSAPVPHESTPADDPDTKQSVTPAT